ncbi:helix-turn-helix domain-containing protein [Leuconostoc citreum]|uniref:helix-turn-helix domain-containing protein n=1 Tax=Leuconostoc citreum TaxID=33964 RepID=UPI0032DF91CA
METIFDRTKKLAKEKHISLGELEKKINIGKNSIYSWKTTNPRGESIQKAAEILDTSTDYLLGRTKNPLPPEDEIDDEDVAMQFRIDMRNVPEDKRDEFKAELRALRKYMLSQLKEMQENDNNKD